MTIQNQSAQALARRAHVEALLADYPDITSDENQLLLRYFRREANALDIGMLASNADIARGYARFRAEHIDRFSLRDVAKGIAGAAMLVLCVALIMLRGI